MHAGLRRLGALVGATALATGASLVVLGSTAGAATFTVTNTADDGTNTSLRDIIENQATTDGDIVNLAANATYTLTCAEGGDIEHGSGTDFTLQTPAGQAPATITIEATCDDRLLQTGEETATINNVVFSGGRSANDSSDTCEDDTDGGAICTNGPLNVVNSTFDHNVTGDDGGAIKTDGLLTVTGSTFSNNCAGSFGGAVEGPDASFTNSTVSNNVANAGGALEIFDELTLVYTDVVENTFEPDVDCGVQAPDLVPSAEDAAQGALADADQPSNISVAASDTLISFGSVVALPLVAGGVVDTPINCVVDSTTSNGYNFSDDDSCGFTNVGTGDRENAGDPQLGALANNGGFTDTRLPATTSPLVNFIPVAACAAGITGDQRGVTRPQDVGCEIGSVELEALVVAFTG